MDTRVSGVGVIDKSFAIIDCVARGPRSLAQLVEETGLNRATVHRLCLALEQHRLIRRSDDGLFALGYRFLLLAHQIDGLGSMVEAARPHLRRLTSQTGESSQLYVRDGDKRVCVVVAESDHGLRTIVPVGARLTLQRGSAGAVLLNQTASGEVVESVGEREAGVASVSAAVRSGAGEVIGALSISGPIDRVTAAPGQRFAKPLLDAVSRLEASLG